MFNIFKLPVCLLRGHQVFRFHEHYHGDTLFCIRCGITLHRVPGIKIGLKNRGITVRLGKGIFTDIEWEIPIPDKPVEVIGHGTGRTSIRPFL